MTFLKPSKILENKKLEGNLILWSRIRELENLAPQCILIDNNLELETV
jgi:hypothetical protein